MIEESEKIKLRELKSESIGHLSSIDLDKYPVLSKTDKRIRIYIESCINNPDAHNLYELLSIVRFFLFLDKYHFKPSEVKKFIVVYEKLKFTGVKGPTRYKLTPIQVFQFANILGFYRTENKRLCREAILFVPRKFSKTTSVASLAINDLLFGDANAQSYVAANSYKQALICFKEIKSILSSLDRRFRYFKINREIVYSKKRGRSSFVECLASNPDKLDGLNASLVILDEFSQADNSEMKNVLTSSMGTRVNPLTVVITTASEKINGPFYEQLSSYKAVLRGEIEDDSVFAHIFEPDVDDDEASPLTWKKVHPHWGITIQEDFYENEYRKAFRSADDMLTFRTKLLNVYSVNAKKAWITADDARKMASDIDIRDFGGLRTMVAIDLSIHDDFSAVSYTRYNEEICMFYTHTDYYIPEETIPVHPNKEIYERWVEKGYLKTCPGNYIDYEMIVRDILKMSEHMAIYGIGYDPYKSQECVNLLGASGFHKVLTPVSQTYGNFTSPVESFEYSCRSGRAYINNNPINFYCFGNAVLDEDRNENKKPIKIAPNRKIDGVITKLMTYRMFNDFEQTI